MSATDLERLRTIVLADAAQQQRLVAITEEDDFLAAIDDLARSHDLDVDADDVRTAMHAGDRRWVERWI